MEPKVQAAIESRRQWFWVWTLGLTLGLGTAIAIHALPTFGQGALLPATYILLVAAGLWLFIATLRLQKALLAWTAFIGTTTALILYFLI